MGYPGRFYLAARFAGGPEPRLSALADEVALSEETFLVLNALWNQGTVGPCTAPQPWAWNAVERAKWETWRELGTMSREEAQRLYVRTTEEECADWVGKALGAGMEPTPMERAAAASAAAGGRAERAAAPPGVAAPGTAGALEAVEAEARTRWAVPPVSGAPPRARSEHAACVVARSDVGGGGMADREARMVVVGGTSRGRLLGDVHVLDVATLGWVRLAVGAADEASRLPPVAGHAAVAAGPHTVYVLGGRTQDERGVGRARPPGGPMRVHVLDVRALQWSSIVGGEGALSPCARAGHSATFVPGSQHYPGTEGADFIAVFGGEGLGGGHHRAALDDVWCLNLDTGSWFRPDVKGGPVAGKGRKRGQKGAPPGRFRHAACYHRDRLYVMGGVAGERVNEKAVFDDMWRLDLRTWTWHLIGAAPSGRRAGHSGAVVGSTWRLVGGGDGAGAVFGAEAFDLDAEVWVEINVEKSPEHADEDPLNLCCEDLSVVAAPSDGPDAAWMIAYGGYFGEYVSDAFLLRCGEARATLHAAPEAVTTVASPTSPKRADSAGPPASPVSPSNDLRAELAAAQRATVEAVRALEAEHTTRMRVEVEVAELKGKLANLEAMELEVGQLRGRLLEYEQAMSQAQGTGRPRTWGEFLTGL